MNLARFLEDWTDVDVAEHALAQVLGIVPPASAMRDAKAVYWSENRLGNELVKFLERLGESRFAHRYRAIKYASIAAAARRPSSIVKRDQ